ncbi:MAG: hypothetical protein AAF558_02625 [Verrucomicrobiota bacterium]
MNSLTQLNKLQQQPFSIAFLGLLFLSCFSWNVTAQSDSSTTDKSLPDPPYIDDAPDSIRWTITYSSEKTKNSDDTSQENPSGTKRIATKNGNLQKETVLYNEQTKVTEWIIDDLVMTHQQGWPDTYILLDTLPPNGNAFRLPELKPEMYVRSESINGESCHYYEARVKDENAGEGENNTLYIQLWISEKTRFPIRVIHHQPEVSILDYAFEKGSTPLKLPEPFRKKYDYYQKWKASQK